MDFYKGLNLAITVCDKDGNVLYQNDSSLDVNGDARTKNLVDCHNARSWEIIRHLIDDDTTNAYTISKKDKKKAAKLAAKQKKNSIVVADGLVTITAPRSVFGLKIFTETLDVRKVRSYEIKKFTLVRHGYEHRKILIRMHTGEEKKFIVDNLALEKPERQSGDNAILPSFKAALTSASESLPFPRRFLNIFCNLSERLSNAIICLQFIFLMYL